MRSRVRAVLAAGMAMLVGATVLGCGGDDFGNPRRASGRTFGTETWYEAERGAGPDEVVLRFEGPDRGGDDDCEPERGVLVEPGPGEVKVTVQRFAPSPVVRCPTSVQTMVADLGEPLGDRALVNPQTGWTFRADGDRFVLDPDTTPCARADCSTPAIALASCNPSEFKAVIDEQLRPGQSPDQDMRCDGTFLVLTRDGRRAWFVNREATWKLLARDLLSCDEIWRMTRVRFPAPMCA